MTIDLMLAHTAPAEATHIYGIAKNHGGQSVASANAEERSKVMR